MAEEQIKSLDRFLQHDSLFLGDLIQLASGVEPDPSAWPPSPEWRAQFRALKTAIDKGELKALLRKEYAHAQTSVRLADLWDFVRSHVGKEWDWLRAFCQRWSSVRGEAAPTEGIKRRRKAGEDEAMIDQLDCVRNELKNLGYSLPVPPEKIREYARALDPMSRKLGYSEQTLRQILAGKYPPARRLVEKHRYRPWW